jgi:hypothetical protein
MTSRVLTGEEVRRRGSEYGRELAAALVLASSRKDADRGLKAEMAKLVLHQIEGAVRKLADASFPPEIVALYESAAREGVRTELLKSRDVAAGLERHAA